MTNALLWCALIVDAYEIIGFAVTGRIIQTSIHVFLFIVLWLLRLDLNRGGDKRRYVYDKK